MYKRQFRYLLPISSKTTDEDAGRLLISQTLFVNVADYPSKLECLLHMIRKLYSLVQGKISTDNPDALVNHELLLPGYLFNMVREY